MRLMLCAVLLALPATSLAATPEQDLVAREASWSKALVNHDMPMLKQIVAPDWTGQNQEGRRADRAQFLNGIASGEDKISSMTNHDVHARVIGDVAIVQGMNDEVSTHKGKSTSGTYSWTDVFQKRNGQWVAIASQNTPVHMTH